MSLTTILLAFAPAAIAARFKPEVKSTDLKRRVLDLERRVLYLESALRRADDRIRELTREREHFRALAVQDRPLYPQGLAQYQQAQALAQQNAQNAQLQQMAAFQQQNAFAHGLAEMIECTPRGGRAAYIAPLGNILNVV